MSYSKRQICEEAFGELALAGYVFELQPEELQTALRRLDGMVAAWETDGLRTGYKLPDPLVGSDIDDQSGIADGMYQTIYTNLAVRLAGVFGKQLTQDTRNTAQQGYDALLKKAAMPQEMQFPSTLPRGAGNKPWRSSRPQFPTPDFDPLQNSQGDNLDILPE